MAGVKKGANGGDGWWQQGICVHTCEVVYGRSTLCSVLEVHPQRVLLFPICWGRRSKQFGAGSKPK